MSGHEIALIVMVLASGLPSLVATLILLRVNRKLDAMTTAVHQVEVMESWAIGRATTLEAERV